MESFKREYTVDLYHKEEHQLTLTEPLDYDEAEKWLLENKLNILRRHPEHQLKIIKSGNTEEPIKEESFKKTLYKPKKEKTLKNNIKEAIEAIYQIDLRIRVSHIEHTKVGDVESLKVIFQEVSEHNIYIDKDTLTQFPELTTNDVTNLPSYIEDLESTISKHTVDDLREKHNIPKHTPAKGKNFKKTVETNTTNDNYIDEDNQYKPCEYNNCLAMIPIESIYSRCSKHRRNATKAHIPTYLL
jgi:hypothetical protein